MSTYEDVDKIFCRMMDTNLITPDELGIFTKLISKGQKKSKTQKILGKSFMLMIITRGKIWVQILYYFIALMNRRLQKLPQIVNEIPCN